MSTIGKMNTLTIIKSVDFGVYLNGGALGEILLPKKFVPEHVGPGDSVEVFLYFDSQDRVIATTVKPLATLGCCAYLKVVDVNQVGAFLEWGLDKHLLVPRSEQQRRMEVGSFYTVILKQDAEGRLFASSRLNRYLNESESNFQQGDKVRIRVAECSDLGQKVIVNDAHWGLIHFSDIFQSLNVGSTMSAYIKKVRPDGKIDISLKKEGYDRINELASRIMVELKKNKGFIALHDKSDAVEIKKVFSESKGSFKKALGHLYKQGLIRMGEDGIHWVEKV